MLPKLGVERAVAQGVRVQNIKAAQGEIVQRFPEPETNLKAAGSPDRSAAGLAQPNLWQTFLQHWLDTHQVLLRKPAADVHVAGD
jgi:hypothetical protein